MDVASLRPLHTATHPVTPEPKGTEAGGEAPAPQIELIKQGDKIVRIVVTCSCGERTEIECLYPPGQ